MKTSQHMSKSTGSRWIIFGGLLLISAACGNLKNDSTTEEAATDEVVVAVIEEVWVIEEHQYNDIPLTSKAENKAPQESARKEEREATAAEETVADAMLEQDYEIATQTSLEEDLIEQEYEALESTVVVTEAIIPLEETQTLVSYAKKDKNDAVIQVISNLQTGEIEQIIFVDAKHQDVYDVQAGLTGKEVKRLRKEVKHMVKKGQVFLYDDQSNIMYLMDAQNMAGDEVTVAEVETMEVKAIVWKDKKHHKKNKKM
jgi:hypothetical protein